MDISVDIFICTDIIRLRLYYGYIHRYFTSFNFNGHISNFEYKLIPLAIQFSLSQLCFVDSRWIQC